MPIFSKRYADFKIELDSVVEYLTANAAEVGVTPEQVTAITAVQTAYDGFYTPYLDGNTRTHADIVAMQAYYPIARHEVNAIQQQIKHNASLDLSEAARLALYIHKDKETNTPSSRPLISPVLTPLYSGRLTTQISIMQPALPEENHRDKPAGVKLIPIFQAVTEDTTAPARTEYEATDSTGHIVHTVQWPAGSENKYGWIIAVYENPIGERGPESAPLMVPIHG